jgi:hypothetical protein
VEIYAPVEACAPSFPWLLHPCIICRTRVIIPCKRRKDCCLTKNEHFLFSYHGEKELRPVK